MKTAREEDPTDDCGDGVVISAPKDQDELAEMGVDKDDGIANGMIEDALLRELSGENSSAHDVPVVVAAGAAAADRTGESAPAAAACDADRRGQCRRRIRPS